MSGNARQRRMKCRIDEQKRPEENRKLIEKYARDGTSYCIQNGKVEKVEVEVFDTAPLSGKRTPITIDDPAFKTRPEEMFNVSNEMFKELVQRWASIINLMTPKKEKENDR